MSRQPPWSAVITTWPLLGDARPSRCRAGTATRPLASRTSSDTPRKTAAPSALPFPACSPGFSLPPTAANPPSAAADSEYSGTPPAHAGSIAVFPLCPTFYHSGELYVGNCVMVNVFPVWEQRLIRKKQH